MFFGRDLIVSTVKRNSFCDFSQFSLLSSLIWFHVSNLNQVLLVFVGFFHIVLKTKTLVLHDCVLSLDFVGMPKIHATSCCWLTGALLAFWPHLHGRKLHYQIRSSTCCFDSRHCSCCSRYFSKWATIVFSFVWFALFLTLVYHRPLMCIFNTLWRELCVFPD